MTVYANCTCDATLPTWTSLGDTGFFVTNVDIIYEPPVDIPEKPHYLPVWVIGLLRLPPLLKKKGIFPSMIHHRVF